MSPWLPKREVPPRFLLTTSPEGTRSRHRTGNRADSNSKACLPARGDGPSIGSVSRRSRSVAVITSCPVGRETRNSRAIAAGLGPAWKAARISRSCPGVTAVALFAALDFAGAGFGGSGLYLRGPDSGERLGRSGPRRRASSATTSTGRSSAGVVQQALRVVEIG